MLGTYFSDVDETSHQVLVAECRNRVLGLLPGSIFHNSDVAVSLTVTLSLCIRDLPASLYHPRTQSPNRQSIYSNKTKREEKPGKKKQAKNHV